MATCLDCTVLPPFSITLCPLHAQAEALRTALERALPLLVRLGDFIGNGEPTPGRFESLGERCDVILDARDALARAGGG